MAVEGQMVYSSSEFQIIFASPVPLPAEAELDE